MIVFCSGDVRQHVLLLVLEQSIEILNQNDTDSDEYDATAELAETVQKWAASPRVPWRI